MAANLVTSSTLTYNFAAPISYSYGQYWPSYDGALANETYCITSAVFTNASPTNLWCFLQHWDSSTSNMHYLFYGTVPAKSSVTVLSRDVAIYLTTNQSLFYGYNDTVGGNNNFNIKFGVSYTLHTA